MEDGKDPSDLPSPSWNMPFTQYFDVGSNPKDGRPLTTGLEPERYNEESLDGVLGAPVRALRRVEPEPVVLDPDGVVRPLVDDSTPPREESVPVQSPVRAKSRRDLLEQFNQTTRDSLRIKPKPRVSFEQPKSSKVRASSTPAQVKVT